MVKAELKYTVAHFKAMHTFFKVPLKQKIMVAITVISLASLTIFDFITSKELSLLFLVATLLSCIYAVLLWLLSYMTSPEKSYRNSLKMFPNASVSITFDDEKFITSQVSDTSSGTSEFQYECIESADKKDGFFILKMKQKQIIAFREDEIIEGSETELCEILKKAGINPNF